MDLLPSTSRVRAVRRSPAFDANDTIKHATRTTFSSEQLLFYHRQTKICPFECNAIQLQSQFCLALAPTLERLNGWTACFDNNSLNVAFVKGIFQYVSGKTICNKLERKKEFHSKAQQTANNSWKNVWFKYPWRFEEHIVLLLADHWNDTKLLPY